jgi:predicted metal-dependent hydrolase
VVRNLRFAIDDEIPRNWMGQPPAVTLFLDHLSMVFPPGERFFIASVRAFEKQVTDPKLREDIRRFNQQEALHGREHVRFNDVLKAHGHPVDAIERSARRILGVGKLLLPKRIQLSITCALEHYTAMLAQLLLDDDSILKDAHPTMSAMWRWHAAEENEHASVAFDVFQATGGTYVQRVIGMLLVTVFFWAKMFEHQVRMMYAAKLLWSPRAWAGLWPMFFGTPGLAFKLWRPYLAYFKPGFHPRELDCTHLLDRWKADFETQPEYVQSLAVKAA